MQRVPAIGVYMPEWLYRSEKSDRMFLNELVRDIRASGRYRAVRFNLESLSLQNAKDAEKFRDKHGLVLVVQHDSSFYSSDTRYIRSAALLEEAVPFLNPRKVHEIGHDKSTTKSVLREAGIPVLEDTVVRSIDELRHALSSEKWFVLKPTNRGAGAGVRLVRSEGGLLLEFYNGSWKTVRATEEKGALVLKRPFTGNIFEYDPGFRYTPMLIEPYFNDDVGGFASIRATVVGEKVVEAVKRVNQTNITSNVSAGGTASAIVLTPEQEKLAVDAKNAIGADYAGVDLLVAGAKSVIGEINIGPFTLFSKHTGASVGSALAAYAMEKADSLVR